MQDEGLRGRRWGVAWAWVVLCALWGCAEGDREPTFGDPCGSQADCGQILQCIQLSAASAPACTAPCNGPADCPAGMECAQTVSGTFCAAPGVVDPGPDLGGEDVAEDAVEGDMAPADAPEPDEGADADEMADGVEDLSPDLGDDQGGCVEDGDCEEGERCEEGECVSVAPVDCEDPFEPNDTIAQATVLAAGSRLEGLGICEADVDVFRFETRGAGASVVVRALFAQAGGDLDLELLDAGGALVARATSQDDDEELRQVLGAAGAWYVRVQGRETRVLNRYALELAVEEVVEPDPIDCGDALEPNDDAQSARILTDGAWSGLRLCAGEDDWYALPVRAGEELTVVVEAQATTAGIELELRGPDRVALLASSAQSGRRAMVSRLVDRDGSVYLRARTAQAGPEVYGMTISRRVVAVEPDCEDALEPNDTREAARPLRAGSYEGLTLCAGEDAADWYALELGAREQLRVDVYFLGSVADIDVRVYRPGETTAWLRGSSPNDDEVVTGEAPVAGLYLLEVYVRGGAPVEYDLSVRVEPATALGPCEDVYEPNNGPAMSAALLPGRYEGLTLCGSAGEVEDWYRVTGLRQGQVLRARISFRDAVSDIDLHLVGINGERLLDQSIGVDDEEEVSATLDTPGTYFLRVFTGLGERNVYTLDIEVSGGSADPLCNDRYEPNNSAETAMALSPGGYTGVGLCGGFDTEDWYAVELVAGQAIDVLVSFDGDMMDIDAQLLEPDGRSRLDWSQSFTGDEEVLEGVAEEAGTHYVRVYTLRGPPTGYEITISAP